MAGKDKQKVDHQFSPDAEFGRSYLIGCGVVFLVFLLGWALIAYFWLSR
jgi:hypothetical protein